MDIRVNSDPGTLPSIPLAFPPSTQTSLIAQSVKKSAYNTGALSLIPGSGRSSGEGNGSPPQCSRLEDPMNRGAWQATVYRVAKSWT